MSKDKPKTKMKAKVKDKPKESLAEKLNQVPVGAVDSGADKGDEEDKEYKQQVEDAVSKLFDSWDEQEFVPQDFQTDVRVDSLESAVGYSSLVRQLHDSYLQMVAFHRSTAGGSLSIEEAREKAFRKCVNEEEAKQIFSRVMSYPFGNIFFSDLHSLHEYAPRVAERLWERIKQEGRAEFESGHLAANTMFPVHYMKGAWNVARYLGLRESFIDEWNPTGGIELSLIDMLAQAFFQWQYWLEETVKRTQTREREEHPSYTEWKRRRAKICKTQGWDEGYWLRPYLTEQQSIEHAVQMADRWNRIYMRTLRQLRDLRRYTPVTINNPSQVNIAADGGQQVNVNQANDEKNC